ncbi:bacillithiol biosynthesis cysteine-adding enzyme BshC [Polluticoccus soli]|uniref:bacillithiol biosynthesis cysteine-adding enzyme BshC n=1 Tax=Polluticoccus soli TaxID=3034150 RepID=UPI0023E30610|nr:bacillithiol biosynthesis cysteine-adding enzyme BshC [Flavipsychrobacter sp. JY13-12]
MSIVHRSFTYLPYSDTGYFSQLVTDYISGSGHATSFVKYSPDATGLQQAINDRGKYTIDRIALVNTLAKQYETIDTPEAVRKNIELLRNETTFTVCTAHQPNLLTGYLYFIYKIVHAIRLAAELKKLHPQNDFVPVYYMGSEDNDLDELGVFNYQNKKWRWDADGQTGAVGRMSTSSLKPLLSDLFKVMGPPGQHFDDLKELLTKSYLEHKTIGDATRFLVNELFGRYGLIVLDPDDVAFKKPIVDIVKDDLQYHSAFALVTTQVEKLEQHYRAQAHPRPINLFYMKDNIRERVEKQGDEWVVINSDISWNKEQLLEEVDQHPERFSPNVILRGLLQERILPNVAFIGGGAEVAYWLQLKSVFEQYNVFYPVILLRQSAQWIHSKQAELREKAGLTVTDVFKDEARLVREYLLHHGNDQWQTGAEMNAIDSIMTQLKQKAMSLDVTLRSSTEAALAKIKHQMDVLEKKMLRAEKRKMHIELARITRLKESLFPGNSLQERKENFTEYFLQYGHSFIDVLYDAFQPLRNEFLIVEEK